MRLIVVILIFVVFSLKLVGQGEAYSLINEIPRIGKPHHETVYLDGNSSKKVFKETYLDGLIIIYRHFRSEKSIFTIIEKDTIHFDEDQNITNGYKTEYYYDFEYLIVTKFENKILQWSKGYFLGEDIIIESPSFSFKLKSGTVLSECRCKSKTNIIENLRWIQFYDAENIKRIQLFDEKTQIEKNVELYPGNQVAVIQTYYTYFEHTDSIFNYKGELMNVYKYDSESNLTSEVNPFVNSILHSLIESEFAWDYFYPFNHCSESMLIGSTF